MESERSDRLALRVRILARVRRPAAIVTAVLVGLSIIGSFDAVQSELRDYAILLAIPLGTATWWLTEVVFGAVMAVIETTHHRLVASSVLPVATLRRRRR